MFSQGDVCRYVGDSRKLAELRNKEVIVDAVIPEDGAVVVHHRAESNGEITGYIVSPRSLVLKPPSRED